jgi:hypothetical protein
MQELEQNLGDGSPQVLVVRQTPDEIEITEIQNDARSTRHYLTYKLKSQKVHSLGTGRAKIRKKTLLLDYAAAIPLLTSGSVSIPVNEDWKLSSDLRILTINSTLAGTETYTRQPSLDSALARASDASPMTKCACLRLPPGAGTAVKSEGGAALGLTAYRQFNRCIVFDAGLTGEFFEGLERSDTSQGTLYRKSGRPVLEFSDELVLEISPHVFECGVRDSLVLPTENWLSPLPPEYLELRFHLRWTGSSLRDLGEVPSERVPEIWSELRPPKWLYRLQIPSKGVPVTDSLEVRILTRTGTQIGCIRGNI